MHLNVYVLCCCSYRVRVLQLPQLYVLDRCFEGAQTVAELVFGGVAEAEVLDVAQVGHPEGRHQHQRNI